MDDVTIFYIKKAFIVLDISPVRASMLFLFIFHLMEGVLRSLAAMVTVLLLQAGSGSEKCVCSRSKVKDNNLLSGKLD